MKKIRVALAVLWVVVIMTLCWLPGTWVREVESESSWFQLPDLDKVVHGLLFVVFSVLWCRAVSIPRAYLAVGLGGILLGVITELVQSLPIVGRDASVADTLTDVVAVVVGLAVAPLIEPALRYIESRLFGQMASRSGRPV